jgi:hypothetical protein
VQRHAGGCRHRPAGPVRCLTRRLGERQCDHALELRRRQGRQTGLARLVAQQAEDPFAHETPLSTPHTRFRDLGAAHDFRGTATLCRGQNNPRPPAPLRKRVVPPACGPCSGHWRCGWRRDEARLRCGSSAVDAERRGESGRSSGGCGLCETRAGTEPHPGAAGLCFIGARLKSHLPKK